MRQPLAGGRKACGSRTAGLRRTGGRRPAENPLRRERSRPPAGGGMLHAALPGKRESRVGGVWRVACTLARCTLCGFCIDGAVQRSLMSPTGPCAAGRTPPCLQVWACVECRHTRGAHASVCVCACVRGRGRASKTSHHAPSRRNESTGTSPPRAFTLHDAASNTPHRMARVLSTARSVRRDVSDKTRVSTAPRGRSCSARVQLGSL